MNTELGWKQRSTRFQYKLPIANPQANKVAKNLQEHLNASDLYFPGTDTKLVYSLGNLE